MSIAVRLRAVRGNVISARELSLLADLSPSMVGHIERGYCDNPTIESIAPIATTLGCSLDWLVSGVGKPPSEEHVREAVEAARARAASAAPAPTGTEG